MYKRFRPITNEFNIWACTACTYTCSVQSLAVQLFHQDSTQCIWFIIENIDTMVKSKKMEGDDVSDTSSVPVIERKELMKNFPFYFYTFSTCLQKSSAQKIKTSAKYFTLCFDRLVKMTSPRLNLISIAGAGLLFMSSGLHNLSFFVLELPSAAVATYKVRHYLEREGWHSCQEKNRTRSRDTSL